MPPHARIVLCAALLSLVVGGAACHSSSTPLPSQSPPPADAGGSVYLWELPHGDGGVSYELDALFPNPYWFRNICDGAPQVSGSCCFFPAADGGGVSTLLAQYSAGDLTLKDATAGSVLGSLAFIDGYGYPVADWLVPGWTPGDTLTVSAPGNQLLPFTISGVTPAHIQGVQPAWDGGLAVDRTHDLTVSWTPDPNGQTMRFLLSSADDAGTHGTIWCQVGDDAGTVTVSSGLLQNFAAGDTCGLCMLVRGNDTEQDGGINLRIQTRIAPGVTYEATFE